MDELDILREQMSAMKSNLDKQQIVNEKLMRTVMRQRSSWTSTYVKAEIIMLPFIYLLIVVICAYYHVSQWFAFTFLILGAIDAALDWRTFRISPKLFGMKSMLEVRRLLIKQKKERFIQTCISAPLAIIWLILLCANMLSDSDSALNIGGAVGGIIGGIIGGIFVIILYRKAQKTNDSIIDETLELDEIPDL